MTLDKTTELIDRYLYAIGLELPAAQREDITRELRTLIEDKLEEQSRARQQPADFDLAVAVLREIGAPAVVARRYHTSPEYLIGPRFYPVLRRILKIGLIVLAFALGLAAVVSHAHAGAGRGFTWTTLPALCGNYLQGAVVFFGWTVLVLAILERVQPGRTQARERWDARDLPPIPAAEEDRVSVPGLTAESVLVLLLLGVLNFAPQWVGVLMVTDGRPGFLPLSDLGVQLPVVAINLWLVLALALKFVVMAQRRWTAATRWLEVAVGAMAVLVAYRIAAGSSLHAPTGLPQLDPAMHLLGRLFFLAPFAIAIQPVLRVIRLLRPAPPAAAGH